MQKKIIALAIAAAFAAPVAAMADVTVYGTMDGGLRHQTNDKATDGTTDTMQMGQYNTARWGFKSVEDMGDGLKTNVVLETSYTPKDVGVGGTAANPFGLIFDRQATIGVAGGFGSLDMGWNYTTSFKTIAAYDPMAYKFLGVAGAKSSDLQDRAGNLVYNGKFGDVKVMAEYMVNNADKTKQPVTGPGRALGVSYAANGLNVGAAYSAVEASTAAGGAAGPTTHMTAGAGYDFGGAKLSVGYAKKANGNFDPAKADATDTNMWLGGSFDINAATVVSLAYYKNAKNTGATGAADSTKSTMMAAVTYALSKKTTAYFEMDTATSNTGVTNALDTKVSGTSIGLNTAF